MEHKTSPAYMTKVDAEQGLVETVFAVMGNVDMGRDIIHNGAFTKTFAERGRKVMVLDQHNTDSVMRVIGKPVEMRELSKAELPTELVAEYPDATGGAWAQVQFLMDTPEGEGAFKRIKSGAISEWSFGYEPLDHDYGKVKQDGEEITVRNLRSLKLFEVSPVLWGMNPATATLSAKEDAGKGTTTDEVAGTVEEMDGEPAEGECLGGLEYDEGAEPIPVASDAAKEMTPRGPVQRLGDVLQGSIHERFTVLCDGWYVSGLLDREERIQLSSLIGNALDVLSEGIPDDVALREVSEWGYYLMGQQAETEEKTAPGEGPDDGAGDQAADDTQDEDPKAGPGAGGEPAAPPTSTRLQREIELELEELELLEV